MDYSTLADKARPALITAAMRGTLLTYSELGRALDLDDKLPLSHHVNRVLNVVAQRCIAAGEPSLAVLVVNQQTGEPGPARRGARGSHRPAEAQPAQPHESLSRATVPVLRVREVCAGERSC